MFSFVNMFSEFGGIYIDADVIVLKSFDPLRRYRTTMGRESGFGICNGIIISAKGAPFIRILLEQYDSYFGNNEEWGWRSVIVVHELAKYFEKYLHVEEASLHRPNWQELDQIFEKTYKWTNNYAIHLWLRLVNHTLVPHSVAAIDCTSTTIGEVARHVIYGSMSRREDCTLKSMTSRRSTVGFNELIRAGSVTPARTDKK